MMFAVLAMIALAAPAALGKPTNCMTFCDEPAVASSQGSFGNLMMPVRPAPGLFSTSLGLAPMTYAPQQVQYASAPMRTYPTYTRPARLETESVAMPQQQQQQQFAGGVESMFAHHSSSSSSQSSMGYYKQSLPQPAQVEPARYVNASPCQYSRDPCNY